MGDTLRPPNIEYGLPQVSLMIMELIPRGHYAGIGSGDAYFCRAGFKAIDGPDVGNNKCDGESKPEEAGDTVALEYGNEAQYHQWEHAPGEGYEKLPAIDPDKGCVVRIRITLHVCMDFHHAEARRYWYTSTRKGSYQCGS
jgi:hypothetical protein